MGFCVLLLHIVAISGFIYTPAVTTPFSPSVEARILPDQLVEERMQPPPAPLITPRPVMVAMPPIVIQQAPAQPSQAPPAILSRGTAAASGPPAPPGPAPPPGDYLRRLAAYLNRYKDYPHDARQRREQGVVRLHFIMDRSGRVLSYDVAGSSGSAALDEAARDLIRRAQPLPPVPPDYPGETLDLVVPVVFSLR